MEYILDVLSKYNCEYDVKYKIFYIKKEISVKDFIYIKKILDTFVNEKIEDIRVDTFNSKRSTYERRF